MNLNELEALARAAKDRADKATPGPWRTEGDCAMASVDDIATVIARAFFSQQDVKFIAAARQDVPALADAIEKLVVAQVAQTTLISELQKAMTRWANDEDGVPEHAWQAYKAALTFLGKRIPEEAGSEGQGL